MLSQCQPKIIQNPFEVSPSLATPSISAAQGPKSQRPRWVHAEGQTFHFWVYPLRIVYVYRGKLEKVHGLLLRHKYFGRIAAIILVTGVNLRLARGGPNHTLIGMLKCQSVQRTLAEQSTIIIHYLYFAHKVACIHTCPSWRDSSWLLLTRLHASMHSQCRHKLAEVVHVPNQAGGRLQYISVGAHPYLRQIQLTTWSIVVRLLQSVQDIMPQNRCWMPE